MSNELTEQKPRAIPSLAELDLRDYFAAKALPEVLAQKGVQGYTREWRHAAWVSYQIADAMLKAREVRND